MGPSRVNPKTGEILDADIIFDDSFLRYWKQEYEVMTPQDAGGALRPLRRGGDVQEADGRRWISARAHGAGLSLHVLPGHAAPDGLCRLGADGPRTHRRQRQAARRIHSPGAQRSRDARGGPHARPAAQLQGQRLERPRRRSTTRRKRPNEAIVASVMDYTPANIAPDRNHPGLLLHAHDRSVRLLGHRIRLQGILRQRIRGTRQNRRPRHRAGPAIRDRRRRLLRDRPAGRTCSTWGTIPWISPSRQMKLTHRADAQDARTGRQEGRGLPEGPPGLQQALPGILADGPIRGQVPGRTSSSTATTTATRNAPAPFTIVDAKEQREGMKLVADHVFKRAGVRSQAAQLSCRPRIGATGASSTRTRLDYPIYEYVAPMQEIILCTICSIR